MTREQVAYLAEVRQLLRSRKLTGVLKPTEVIICLNCKENYLRPSLAMLAIGRYRNQHADADTVCKYMNKRKSAERRKVVAK